jgi:hypothetical protein
VTFVIPTRDRADLARAAVDGLLAETDDSRVLVSDNSTDDSQAEQLAGFCRNRGDARLSYLRAPALVMPAHWDWALQRALEQSDSTHFSIHYDRNVAKTGRMPLLLDAVERNPEHTISYTIDQVELDGSRYRVWQPPCSGGLHEIETAQVVRMVAAGRVDEIGRAFPVLSNCAIPRQALVDIRDRFGNICDSAGPDVAFLFRFCALERSYLHLDHALSVGYASHRSNGRGYMSGKQTDYEDFKAAWGERPWLDAVPLPGLDLGWNLLFHEYELVRREVGDAFPPLSKAGYLRGLAWGLRLIDDEGRRAELEALLEQNGWERQRGPYPRPVTVGRRGWLRRQLLLARVRALGTQPAHVSGYRFAREPRALFYAKKISRLPEPDRVGLAWIDEDLK